MSLESNIELLEHQKEERQIVGDLYSANADGTITFNLHPGQWEVYNAKERFILMLCGTQSGKTSFIPIWLYKEISERGVGDYLAISPTYRLMTLKLLPELKKLFENRLGYEFNSKGNIFSRKTKNETTGDIEETRIICVSTDTEGALESSTAKGAVFDEAGMAFVKPDAWRGLVRRLSLNEGRCLITTTPYQLGWLKTMVHDKCGVDPDYKLVNFRSCDNPRFPMKEYLRVKEEMPAWQFDMFYNGIFTRPSGLIYMDFIHKENQIEVFGDEVKFLGEGHIIKPFVIPPHWRRYVGVDFGDRNPCALWLAEVPNTKTYIVFRELFGKEEVSANYIKSFNENPKCIGGALNENDWRDIWAQDKMPVLRPLINDVEAGINHTAALFKQNRLYLFNTLTETIKELDSYSRVCDDMGEPTDAIADKNKYHHMDALRYACSEFPTSKTGKVDRKKKEQEMEMDIMDRFSRFRRGVHDFSYRY